MFSYEPMGSQAPRQKAWALPGGLDAQQLGALGQHLEGVRHATRRHSKAACRHLVFNAVQVSENLTGESIRGFIRVRVDTHGRRLAALHCIAVDQECGAGLIALGQPSVDTAAIEPAPLAFLGLWQMNNFKPCFVSMGLASLLGSRVYETDVI